MYFYTVEVKVEINQDQETYFNEQYLSKNEMEFYSEIPTVIVEKCLKKELTEENYKTLKDFIFNIPENITRYEINGYQ